MSIETKVQRGIKKNKGELKLGGILVKSGRISAEQLQEALRTQHASGKRLGHILIELEYISELELARALARQKQISLVDLKEYNVDLKAASSIPERVATQHMIIPIDYKDGELIVAMANPLDICALDDLRTFTDKKVKPVVGTESEINAAIGKYLRRGELRLGEILVKSACISAKQLQEALRTQHASGKRLGHILIELDYISELDLARALARQKQIKLVDLKKYSVDLKAASSIPERVATQHMIIPIDYKDGELIVAMANPLDICALDDVRTLTDKKVKPVVSTESEINVAIGKYLRGHEIIIQAANTLLSVITEEKEEVDIETVKSLSQRAPIIRLTEQIILEALDQAASDIHIEPQSKHVQVRYRIDGVLHNGTVLPKNVQAALVSRLKIICNLDITKCTVPQDGRCEIVAKKRRMDLRLATLPTIYGESVTLRILDKNKELLKLEQLSFQPEQLRKLETYIFKPYGAILTTGPTGSGKTITLQAILETLNTPEKKIVTLEDPVEYRLPGTVQVQVSPTSGLTFAKGLKSILRCDSDIIMVGEIRDLETARMAIQLVLSGHLVLSSLHSKDAPSVITRLVDIGVEPFLVASAVNCVLAQKLARKLCGYCKEQYKPGPNSRMKNSILYRAKGCSRCFGTGYKGRVGLFEIMPLTDEIRDHCLQGNSSEAIKQTAIEQGMTTLEAAGWKLVLQGITSVEELIRVIQT